MKSTPLYEFMPYGAPELIEARRSHMSRALAVTSAAAILLYGAVMGLAPLLRSAPPPVERPIVFDPHDLTPPPIVKRPPMAPPTVFNPIPPAPKYATPVLVPDNLAPQPAPTAPPSGPLTDPRSASTDPLPAPGSMTGDVVPGIHEYVYVERVPEAVKQVKPVYSDIARSAGIEGKVMVRVLVGKDGHVLDARVEEKFSVPMLNDAALTAARQWVFTPGLANQQPVMCWVTIPFNFRLH